jgi:hypothetical protein
MVLSTSFIQRDDQVSFDAPCPVVKIRFRRADGRGLDTVPESITRRASVHLAQPCRLQPWLLSRGRVCSLSDTIAVPKSLVYVHARVSRMQTQPRYRGLRQCFIGIQKQEHVSICLQLIPDGHPKHDISSDPFHFDFGAPCCRD